MARKRDSKGRFDNGSFMSAAYERPLAGVAVAAGVAAAGAFLWSRRGQIGEAFSSGMDRLSELKAERMGNTRSQEEISEEALTLKETGRKSKVPRNVARQETQPGIPTVS
jgi:hypothetical protein